MRESMHSAISLSKTEILDSVLNDFSEVVVFFYASRKSAFAERAYEQKCFLQKHCQTGG